MTDHQKLYRNAKSMMGTAFAGLGSLALYQVLAAIADGFRHMLAFNSSEALGLVPSLILAISGVFQTHSGGDQRFLEGAVQQALALAWPLLLTMAGTVLSRCAGDVATPSKINCAHVDLTATSSTLQ